jgi:hypothetical protein
VRIALLALVLFTGCATTLLAQDIQRQSDGWTVTFHKLTDGPDGFTTTDATNYSPSKGQRFLWVTLSVRNDSKKARQFTFDSCALDGDGASYLPLYVGYNFGTTAEVTKSQGFGGLEEITRKLAFGYPKGRFPDRLVCFGNQIPLKRIEASASPPAAPAASN